MGIACSGFFFFFFPFTLISQRDLYSCGIGSQITCLARAGGRQEVSRFPLLFTRESKSHFGTHVVVRSKIGRKLGLEAATDGWIDGSLDVKGTDKKTVQKLAPTANQSRTHLSAGSKERTCYRISSSSPTSCCP